jgi:hypothetical protein
MYTQAVQSVRPVESTGWAVQKGSTWSSKTPKHGQTPPSWAAEKGREEVVELLLEKGADMESEDASGQTPLWWAAKYGHEAVVRLLLEKGATWTPNLDLARRRCGEQHGTRTMGWRGCCSRRGPTWSSEAMMVGRRWGGRHGGGTRRWRSCCSRTLNHDIQVSFTAVAKITNLSYLRNWVLQLQLIEVGPRYKPQRKVTTST